MEISYCDLKRKEVVNVTDGKRLGRILDIIISLHSCRVLGIVVPGNRKIFNTREDIFIPWKNIQKIGDDVILVCFLECNFDKSDNIGHKCPPNRPLPQKNIPVSAFGEEESEYNEDDE
jgi:YlmC/YmxH family sporulation protein